MKGLFENQLQHALIVLLLFAAASAGARAAPEEPRDAQLQELVAEAVRNNPEIRAASNEAEAARQRVSPAGALDDPMLEAGLLNVPTDSWRLNREDMTMKMLGLAQRLPFPGKRALRREVAERDAGTAEHGYRETVNRVAREVKLAYFDLALALESVRLLKDTTLVLEQFLRIVESRYAVGQGAQADVFKAQTQLAKMREELLRMERERPVMEAELAKLLGRPGVASIAAPLPGTPQSRLDLESLRETARRQRPQLLALRNVVEKNNASIKLARKEYNPDFDVRLSYGQRESMLDGTKRPDMVSLTVAINLPIWGKDKVDPRIAEARSMRDQAQSMYNAQQNEVFAKLRQQVAIAEQSRKSAELYDTAILPQARLAVESALSAYRVNRVDLLTLLDSQMSLFNFGIGRATAVVNLNKALAEIGLLTGAQQI
jgi:cobalt-zinc-cadmium efflux system outer membrane protein